MAKDIKIPQIAEGVDTATVTEILISEGDTIKKDQSLITVESDKASVEIPSPEAGTVKSIKVSEGDEVHVGDVIVTLEATDEDSDDKDASEKEGADTSEDENSEKEKKKKPAENDDSDDVEKTSKKEGEKKQEEKENSRETEKEADASKDNETSEEDESAEKKKSSDEDEAPASPGVRRFARELGIDINSVKGSGDDGRISKKDIKAYTKNSKSQSEETSAIELPDFNKWGETETKALSGIRAATAKNTSMAWKHIPHVFQFDESDISGIENYMEKNREKVEEAGGKLTITAILVKIAAAALRQFPKFNASIDMDKEEMILKKYVNIGVAVATGKGLLVPVIKDADQKTISDIALEISNLAEKARAGKLSAEEMQGGTFTISNLGGIGGTNFTPIVYHPQVAILGVSRAKKQPVYIKDNIEPRDILPLSLSYDHRIIDGAEGVRFLNWIARALEDPYKALLGV